MNIRYIVELRDKERAQLQELTGGGKARVRRVKRAQIPLAAEQGHGEAAIAATVGVGISTVYRTKRRFVAAEYSQRIRCADAQGTGESIA